MTIKCSEQFIMRSASRLESESLCNTMLGGEAMTIYTGTYKSSMRDRMQLLNAIVCESDGSDCPVLLHSHAMMLHNAICNPRSWLARRPIT